jgi:lysylphosphatidylglycerol synthetase-like protein (DUF2156 family)
VICGNCGISNSDTAEVCRLCGHKLRDPKGTPTAGESFKRKVEFYGRTERMIPKTKSITPVAAGAILVINAILAIGGLYITNIYVSKFLPEASQAMTATNLVFGALAIFVLIGGVLAMLRKKWAVTLVASVASFFLALAFGLFCSVLEAVLSLAALVLLAQARDEFKED